MEYLQALKAHIKLNTKRLYSADGYAVKELLKVTTVLYSAMKSNNSDSQDMNSTDDDSDMLAYDISSRVTFIYLLQNCLLGVFLWFANVFYRNCLWIAEIEF